MTSRHPAVPPRVAWPWLLGAAGIWLVMAFAGSPPVEPVGAGSYDGWVTMRTDVLEGRYGRWAIASLGATKVLVEFDDDLARRGDRVLVQGHVEDQTGKAGGHTYGGVLDVREVEQIERSRFWPHRAGRLVISRVEERLAPYDTGRGLLAGFLVGDVSRVSDADVEAMRLSGLAHFVAVSGSNVALFLALLAFVAGPLAMGPRRRALLGLMGLPIYAAATRFEPSVMRASVMAAIALVGRLVGIALEAWQLLALAVAVLLILDPGLTANVGFQLSVVATAGVLVGARWPARGRFRRALAVTLGAQIGVAPLLLFHFGSVPLLSPVTNLVTAPLVAASTVVGAIGVAGPGALIGIAGWAAELVLQIARGAARWPQLGPLEFAMLLAVAGAVLKMRSLRPAAAAVASIALMVHLAWPAPGLPPATVAVLDVGQGDAILLSGGDGHHALVDGGPDPEVLRERLRRYGVQSIDLVVMTHVHADHATGLSGVVGVIPITRVWEASEPHSTSSSTEFLDRAGGFGIPIEVPQPGDTVDIGALKIEVVGPLRRYASPNDQSIVLRVVGSGAEMLLTGDIETFAQADLAGLRADVIKVPHQGAATSDPAWLASVGATTAVISVGPNQFGHPAEWVVDLFASNGTEVLRTDRDGDVIVDLGRAPPSDNLAG